jgi:hypothetical protein
MNDPIAAPNVATPWHLWLVGGLALLWNGVGALDYVMTETRNAPYMSTFTPEQLAYFYGFPMWVVSAWALSVWGGVLGAILLLLRKRWAVPVFGVSLATFVLTSFHNFVLTNGLAIMGAAEGAVFSAVIFAIAVVLLLYARRLARNGEHRLRRRIPGLRADSGMRVCNTGCRHVDSDGSGLD